MKIIKLVAENVKRLHAVEVAPTGDLVVVGGKNDAGKSSLLDAIEMGMKGEAATPAHPVRRGQKAAKIVLDLGDLVVTRTYTEAGGRKLIVANKDGARFPSPQAMLDRLYGALAFDPLAFERLEPKQQAETLRALVGLDFSVLDGKRAAVYDERAQVNRDVRRLTAVADTFAEDPDAPAEEVSIEALTAELAEADRTLEAVDWQRRRLAELAHREQQITLDVARLETELRDLETAVARKRGEIERATAPVPALLDEREMVAGALEQLTALAPDREAIRRRMVEADETNRRVRVQKGRETALAAVQAAKATADELSAQIEGIDAQKADKLATTAFPVAGLGIGPDGVMWNGLPFEQASTSDRIRVSVAIGLAMNPTLKVLLVRDGSLLGTEKIALLGDMASAAGAQVWLEMLQEAPDGRTTVFIEDGSVVAPEAFAGVPEGLQGFAGKVER